MGTTLRPLTPAELDRLATMRETYWEAFDDDDLCRLRQDMKLADADFNLLVTLIAERALDAEIASGFTTPNPFVLVLERPGRLEMMIHPSHVPGITTVAEAETLFRRLANP